jgi:hypothetical protein
VLRKVVNLIIGRVGSRSILNLKLDDPKADVEVVLVSVRMGDKIESSFSYFV